MKLKILLFDYNNVLTDVAKALQEKGHILLPLDAKEATFKKADVIVVWNETAIGLWRDWIVKAREQGKRVVLVQHGRRGTSRIFPPFNETLVSDVVCVWGESDRKRMESCGVPKDRIHVTGTPIFRHLKPRVAHQGVNVVFSPEHWDIDVVENVIVRGILSKMKDVNIITKLLTDSHNPNEYQNPVISDRSSPGHLEIVAEVLSKADAVVAISESTFELLAEMLDIPVIIADIWIPKPCNGDERYRDYHREYSPACLRVKDMRRFEEAIRESLKHPEHLRAERHQVVIDDGGINIQNPIAEIIKVIENGKSLL